MNEYYFLFGVALVYLIIAVIQDLKTTEISNWLNFSFMVFALSYRFFYSYSIRSYEFFYFGLIGFLLFFGFGLAFYYTKVFGGGDAKLLAGLGAVLPYDNYLGVFYMSFVYILILFGFGAFWSLIYSLKIIYREKKKFLREFDKNLRKSKFIIASTLIISIFVILFAKPFYFGALVGAGVFLIPFLWVYVRALEKCMIVLTKPIDLIEGDWLNKEVYVGKKKISKSVHGLSLEEIRILKKANKSVWIKQGVPFTPAFLLSLIFMVTFYSFLQVWFSRIFLF
jgi:prepilin signal peptidase PulO-like enzyme (type II secretory pathway)